MAKVIWTDAARGELALIYQYLLDNTSPVIARGLIEDILDVMQLEQFPQSGAIEANLKRLEGEYRYLVRGHSRYKVVYKVVSDAVYIIDVFDCRKDPKQMRGRAR